MSKDKILYLDCTDPGYKTIHECSEGPRICTIRGSELDTNWTQKGLDSVCSIIDDEDNYTLVLDNKESLVMDPAQIYAVYMLLDYTLKHSTLPNNGRYPAKFLKFKELEDD